MKQSIIITFLIFNIMFVSFCAKNKKNEKKIFNKGKIIETSKAELKDFIRKFETYGYVIPLKKADVVAYTSGVIKNIWKRDGSMVRKGERILSIEGYFISKAIESGIHNRSYSKNSNIVKRAPVSGFVILKRGITGVSVVKGDIVASVVDLDSLMVETEIFDGNAIKIEAEKSKVLIYNRGTEFEGVVVSISPAVNRETGGRKIGIKISQTKPYSLLPGEFVKIEIIGEQHLNSVSVPESALLYENGKSIVMVMADMKYKRRIVYTGMENNGYVEILEGIKEGETVVTAGAYELFNINIKEKIKIED